MPGYVLGNFLIYCIVNAFTPGPGNILALNTVNTYGWRRGRPLFLGIFAGCYVVQILCALIVYGGSAFLPNVMGVLKYIGAAYILWLAIHIAISKPTQGSEEKAAAFLKGFMLQFVNVKIYMFGITALTGFVVPHNSVFVALLFFEIVIGSSSSSPGAMCESKIWTAGRFPWSKGIWIQKRMKRPSRFLAHGEQVSDWAFSHPLFKETLVLMLQRRFFSCSPALRRTSSQQWFGRE